MRFFKREKKKRELPYHRVYDGSGYIYEVAKFKLDEITDEELSELYTRFVAGASRILCPGVEDCYGHDWNAAYQGNYIIFIRSHLKTPPRVAAAVAKARTGSWTVAEAAPEPKEEVVTVSSVSEYVRGLMPKENEIEYFDDGYDT